MRRFIQNLEGYHQIYGINFKRYSNFWINVLVGFCFSKSVKSADILNLLWILKYKKFK